MMEALTSFVANVGGWFQSVYEYVTEFYANNTKLFWIIVGIVGVRVLFGIISLVA